MTALQWLGGSEADLEHRRMLVGFWQDRRGSIYVLSPGNTTATLSVLTTRPDGQKRFTRDLIVARCDTVIWGKGAKQFIGTVWEDRVSWHREGTVFNWIKLQ